MRLHRCFLASLLAATPPAVAQVPAAHMGWRLGIGIEAVRFGHVAVGEAAPGVAAEVRPSARQAVHMSVERSVGAWNLGLEAGWAGGHIEIGNEAVSVQDRQADVSRYRLAVEVGRRVAMAGAGTVMLVLVPALDIWSVEGDGRARAGVEARLALRVPLGGVELENRIGAGVSGNPIEMTDVGEVSDLRELRTLSAGVGLRIRI